ncbi:DNA topoisomerase IV subunit A [Clostridium algidicarnis]|uniref:DNA topoisomerase IV subunit A n=1 Tax=Clostridium algidicarnis TaxID=37659 RepID=UPI001624DFCA|nr:DNA topoisomerase IV subunit A [Clostridium algidicarnis]MBB6696451.1 DNA topoisomerase IV subunit A [Clostridium algidicarnis]MBU3205778.1 DNA topoisomerase IV subunit A [Clostridium algidicarnis]
MAKKFIVPKDNNIIEVPLEEAMPENYLPYAVEVAKDRALPDVRDGLKPVHRRILYGAYLLKAFPDKAYFKSARIVGDILGKFHPHGDTSVYDAMTILAQDFSTRYKLIDGHGNWGSMDGDGAAAMRYTEARLTPLALQMIRDIDKDVVDMALNYSDTEFEPTVLPSRYPNLLVNGAFGIAVGLATNIPPHNLKEVIDASIKLMEDENITTKELMEYIKGPDLPTGGIILGKESLLAAYETGEGKVTSRAKTSIETLENGRLGIIITEFPYRKNKSKILQAISDMTGDKKHAKYLESIVDIRDESDRTGVRSVVELKKTVEYEDAEKVLKYLFKKTDLQCNINFNMVALANGKPETLGLKSILKHYVNHQKEVVIRRTKRELNIAEKRFHIVEGFIKAVGAMDEIISIIRASKSKKDASNNLIERFEFSKEQTEAILELMLYRLTGLEIKVFEKEYKELSKVIKSLKNILENEKELLKVIKSELLEIRNTYGDERRTKIVEDDSEGKIDLEELLVVEDIMVTLSKDGFIKRVPMKSYNRINSDISDIEYREGDAGRFLFQSNTKDTILVFTNKGQMYQIRGNDLPERKWKDNGVRLDSLIRSFNLDEETIVDVYSIENFSSSLDFMFLTSKGNIKKTSLDKFQTNYSRYSALKLKKEDYLIDVKLVKKDREEGFINIITKKGLNFDLEEPKLEESDRNVLGQQLFLLCKEDEIIKAEYCKEMKYSEMIIGVNPQGNLKSFKKNSASTYKKVLTNSKEFIIIFTDRGFAYKIPGFMIGNIEDSTINIEDLVDTFLKGKEKVLNILSSKDFNEEIWMYFFTKRGMIKKTNIKELKGEYIETQVYKYKYEDDTLVTVEFGKDQNQEILLVTEKAMGIKFTSNSIKEMGKVASGVTGISLKEEDKVVFGTLTENSDDSNSNLCYNKEIAFTTNIKSINLLSSSGRKEGVKLEDIKLQNRAGRGNNIMAISTGEYIKDIKLK